MSDNSASADLEFALWTIGHSTRSSEDFIQLLHANRIECLVDVRSFPGSKRLPQFNRGELAEKLPAVGIAYVHLPNLGGRRRANPESHNTAWQNPSFRAYADHMESEEFKQGIEELLLQAKRKRTSIMCAEAVWWRCHRALISDCLKSEGVAVFHILNERSPELHPFTSAARIVEGKLSYRGLLP